MKRKRDPSCILALPCHVMLSALLWGSKKTLTRCWWHALGLPSLQSYEPNKPVALSLLVQEIKPRDFCILCNRSTIELLLSAKPLVFYKSSIQSQVFCDRNKNELKAPNLRLGKKVWPPPVLTWRCETLNQVCALLIGYSETSCLSFMRELCWLEPSLWPWDK